MFPIKRRREKHLHFSTNLLLLIVIGVDYHLKLGLATHINQHNDYDEHYRLHLNNNNNNANKTTNLIQMISSQTNNNKNNSRQQPSNDDTLLGDTTINNPRIASATSQHLDGDLLAVETSRLLSIGKPAAILPPYASEPINATTPDAINNNNHSDSQPLQLLKLYRAPPAPIFIRHQIQTPPIGHNELYRRPSSSGGGQDESLSVLKQQASEQALRHNNDGVFALLPSWPSVYVAQRPTTSTSDNFKNNAPSNHLLKQIQGETTNIGLPPPPANASQLPNWTTTTRDRTEEIAPKRTQQQQQHEVEEAGDLRAKGEKLLQNSSVEYIELPQDNNQQLIQQQQQESDIKQNHHHHQEPLKQLKLANSATNNNINQVERDEDNKGANWTQLMRQAADNNLMESLMVTNKTIVSLLCDPNEMLVRFKFKKPFYGLIETNLDSANICRLFGNGSQYYELHVSLYGCGTRQEMPRLFVNNLNIQFLLNNNNNNRLESKEPLDSNESSDELKTIICSYPIKGVRAHKEPPPIRNADQLDNNRFDNNEVAFKNKSERIIEVPPSDRFQKDEQDTIRHLVFYDPLLLVSGLLLLAFVMVALTTGVYLVQRRRQRHVDRRRYLADLGSSSGAGSTSSLTSRIYRGSPAQLANQRPLVAPPLISSSGTNLGKPKEVAAEARQKQISMRPTGRRYADERPSQLLISACSSSSSSSSPPPASISKKRNLLAAPLKPSTSNYKRRLEQERSAQSRVNNNNNNNNKQSEKQQQPVRKHNDDSLDSGGQSSVTTIEIPYASRAASRSSPKRPAAPSATSELGAGHKPPAARPEKFNTMTGDNKQQASKDQAGENKRPRIINTTVEARPLKRASPLPFGSFRSKLTSPVEFRRLENISRTFSNVPGGHSLRPTKYYSKIMRTFNEGERAALNELFQSDEVFRSMVVDSIDRETFRRKLRNNAKYSNKFRPESWHLMEEIFLDAQMSQLITSERERFEARLAMARPPPPSPSPSSPGQAANSQAHLKRPNNERHEDELNRSRNYKETNLTCGSSSDSLNEQERQEEREPPPPSSSTGGKDQPKMNEKHNHHHQQQQQDIPIVRVSQFNSTRTTRDGGTLINVDSVTNISSTGSFGSYKTSRIEQTTSYLEENLVDDSLPFVDERHKH